MEMEKSAEPRHAVGTRVLYTLSNDDVAVIEGRRKKVDTLGALANDNRSHGVGNRTTEGDVYPGLIVRAWGGDRVNLQVFLDGDDSYWATSRLRGEGPGTFDLA